MQPATRNRALVAGVLVLTAAAVMCAPDPEPSAYMPDAPTWTAPTPTPANRAPEEEEEADDTAEALEQAEAPEVGGDMLRCPLPAGLEAAAEATLTFAPQVEGYEAMTLGLRVSDGAVQVAPEVLSLGSAWVTVPGLGIAFPERDGGSCQLVDPIFVTEEAAETRCPLSLPEGVEASFSADLVDQDAAILEHLGGGPAPVLHDTYGAVEGDTLIISGAPSGTGALWLTAEGLSIDAPVAWEDGRCERIVLPEPATISGEIGPMLDAAMGRIEICDRAATVPAQDPRYALMVWPGRCEATASRLDGVLTAYGEIVELEIRSGEEIALDLALPEEKVGGMGFRLAEHPDGIVLEEVYPGNPAADAGLQAGDVIVAIDGEPADELSTEGFVRLGVGPVGTDVTVTVRREDGTEEDVTLSRDELVVPGGG